MKKQWIAFLSRQVLTCAIRLSTQRALGFFLTFPEWDKSPKVMNVKSFILLTVTLLTLTMFAACRPDPKPDPDPTPQFEKKGVFIISEGTFGSGTGSLAFYDYDDDKLIEDVFQTQNNGAFVGNIFQSMAFVNDKGFLVANNAKKIEVVNQRDFTSLGTVLGLQQPRFVAKRNETEAYVSQWGASGSDGQINVINTNDYTIVDSIVIGGGPEQLLVSDSKLYVPNSGGWSTDSVVSVYNISDNTLVKSITVGGCPTRILKSDDGVIWVSSTGCYVANGAISKIENDEATHIYEFSHGQINAIDESPDGGMLFLIRNQFGAGSGQGVYRFDKSTSTFEGTPIIEGAYYGIGVDKTYKKLYLGLDDGSDDGKVLVYDLDASNMPTFVDTMLVGRFPNGFLFQE